MSPLRNVFILTGMTMGFGIMLLISIYEHDLKDMFTADESHSHEHLQPKI